MPKARVYDLAKELGIGSKDVLNKLKEMGEFVKSASSTVEPPVARKIRNAFAAAGQGTGSKGASSQADRQHAGKPGSSTGRDAGKAAKGSSSPSAAQPGAAKPGTSRDTSAAAGKAAPGPAGSAQHNASPEKGTGRTQAAASGSPAPSSRKPVLQERNRTPRGRIRAMRRVPRLQQASLSRRRISVNREPPAPGIIRL